jgi:MYXO-CTERM domain-containing protein
MKKIATLLTLGLLSFVSSVAFAQEAPVADPCTQLDICLSGCDESDDACTGACFEEADPEVAAAYQAIEECFAASGCAEDDFECIEESCAEVFEAQADACFGGGENNSSGNNGGVATGPCADLFECSESCEDEDLACAQACVDQMSNPRGQAVAQALLDCVEAETPNCSDDDCLFSACAEQAETFGQVCDLGDISVDGNSASGNNSSNDGNNGGVFPGGNNGGVGSDGGGNNSSNDDDNGAGGEEESDSDADSEEAESSCATAGMGGKVGHGGLGLVALGLVALGLRRRRA